MPAFGAVGDTFGGVGGTFGDLNGVPTNATATLTLTANSSLVTDSAAVGVTQSDSAPSSVVTVQGTATSGLTLTAASSSPYDSDG